MARKGKLNEHAQEEVKRPIRIKRYEYLFLIVCEDQKTEKEYFDRFRSDFPEKTVYLKTIGSGLDPKGVVEKSILERDILAREAEKDVDVVWAVFDKDDADLNDGKKQRFFDAFRMAGTEKINLAFSNEVFELWLLLFLADVSSEFPLPRNVIYNMLQKAIASVNGFADFVYEHGNTNILSIIDAIGDENLAAQRADKLLEAHFGKEPIEMNPSTMVLFLVREIRGWIKYYNYTPD